MSVLDSGLSSLLEVLMHHTSIHGGLMSGDKPVIFSIFHIFSCIFPAIWRPSRALGLTLGKFGYFKIRSYIVAEKRS